jgi:hypothetical protein
VPGALRYILALVCRADMAKPPQHSGIRSLGYDLVESNPFYQVASSTGILPSSTKYLQ